MNKRASSSTEFSDQVGREDTALVLKTLLVTVLMESCHRLSVYWITGVGAA